MVKPRLWLIFFRDGDPSWWAPLFRRGFRHVCAAAWFPDQARWVYVDPVGQGLHVEVLRADEFAGRWEQLLTTSTEVLRMRTLHGRHFAPTSFYCVGAIKALIGIRSRALSPFGLYRDLRAHGAETVERPKAEEPSGIFEAVAATGPNADGGPGPEGAAAPATAACGGRSHPVGAGSAEAGDAAA